MRSKKAYKLQTRNSLGFHTVLEDSYDSCVHLSAPTRAEPLAKIDGRRAPARRSGGENRRMARQVAKINGRRAPARRLSIFMAGWMDGWLNGWMVRWMAGWLAGWMARPTGNNGKSSQRHNIEGEAHCFSHKLRLSTKTCKRTVSGRMQKDCS